MDFVKRSSPSSSMFLYTLKIGCVEHPALAASVRALTLVKPSSLVISNAVFNMSFFVIVSFLAIKIYLSCSLNPISFSNVCYYNILCNLRQAFSTFFLFFSYLHLKKRADCSTLFHNLVGIFYCSGIGNCSGFTRLRSRTREDKFRRNFSS